MRELDPGVRAGVDALAADLVRAGGDDVVAVYVHGSAVLGGFVPGVSDLDVLVVVRDETDHAAIEHLAQALRAADVEPATGIEASVVTAAAAGEPVTPWPYQVHVSTSPADPKVVWCAEGDGDSDLVLHYAVTHAAGWAAHGPAPESVIGELHSTLVRRHLVAELRWAADHAPMPYAVLNACRVLRWDADGVVCSKSDGAEWALERDIATDLVRPALAARGAGEDPPLPANARAWVLDVASRLGDRRAL